MRAVPMLPVLPRSIPSSAAGLTTPRTIGVTKGFIGNVVLSGPAGAVEVVSAPLGGVGQDGVGGDDEAVAVKLGGVGESVGRAMRVAVGVVKFHELVKGLFGVGCCPGRGEDIVGCWVCGGRPSGNFGV